MSSRGHQSKTDSFHRDNNFYSTNVSYANSRPKNFCKDVFTFWKCCEMVHSACNAVIRTQIEIMIDFYWEQALKYATGRSDGATDQEEVPSVGQRPWDLQESGSIRARPVGPTFMARRGAIRAPLQTKSKNLEIRSWSRGMVQGISSFTIGLLQNKNNIHPELITCF